MRATKSHSQIAREIGCTRQTVWREITRNAGLGGYRPKQAHDKAMQGSQTAAVLSGAVKSVFLLERMMSSMRSLNKRRSNLKWPILPIYPSSREIICSGSTLPLLDLN